MTHIDGGQFRVLLRSYRRRAGLTQEQLAGLSTVSVRAIRDLELGRAQNPRHRTVRLLADGLRLGDRGRAALEFAAGRTGADHTLKEVYDAEKTAPPFPLGPLIGRAGELRSLTDMMGPGRERLVTITGIGGAGKTRLALEFAHMRHAEGRMPVLWTGRDRDGGAAGQHRSNPPMAMLEERVQGLLGMSGTTVEELATLIGDHPAMLVTDGRSRLDGRESVLDLLHACPGLHILVTSREPCRIPGERLLPLAPLAVPPPGHDDVAELATSPAVRLWLSHAQHLRPGFQLTAAHAASVATICRNLDGLPLALEAAANWLVMSSVEEMARTARQDPLELATSPSVVGRSSPVRESLEASVDALDPDCARVLSQLARLDRPWSVRTVTRLTHTSQAAAARAVYALAVRGLIRPGGVNDAAAFTVLTMVRQVLADPDRASVDARRYYGRAS